VKCYWASDAEIGRFHVPGCMGAAIYGPGACTCSARSKQKSMEQKIVELEERVRKLESSLRAERE
jgi:hypothetical protein